MRSSMRFTLAAAVVAYIASAGQASAAMLVGVTGDGAATPESLFFLDQTNASATFIMSLGSGDDGETIGFNPIDGLLYHASGISDGNRSWESIDVHTATIVSSGPLTGPDVNEETFSIAYNSATGRFLAADRVNGFFDVALDGTATKLGTTTGGLKGLAFVGNTLYGARAFGASGILYSIDPATGGVLDSLTVTLDGASISGMNGLATNPDTGELWGIFRSGNFPGVRSLGIIDLVTGNATSVGVLSDNFAGIAFVESPTVEVPEPTSLVLFGSMALMGLVVHGRRVSRTSARRFPSLKG